MSREDVRGAVSGALATVLGACALAPVFTSAAWVPPVVEAVLAVLATGLLLRLAGPALWSRATDRAVPRGLATAGVVLVPLAQLGVLATVLTARFAPGHEFAGVLPTWRGLTGFGAVLSTGTEQIREQATPALPLAGLLALTALSVGLIAVVVDLLAVAGRQAALAGLGLLALYCVPVATITGGIGLVAVAAPAAGMALLLWTDQHRRLATAGRASLTRPGIGAATAARVGLGALVAGVVLGSVVPTLAEGSLATGFGDGAGSSTGTALDPVAALQGQLSLPDPIELLRMDSSVADPGYLRAVAVDEYDAEGGWTMSALADDLSIAGAQLAPPSGFRAHRTVTATIEVLEHDDRFLPAPFAPMTVQMIDGEDDDWRFDPATGTVHSLEARSGDTRYAVTAAEPRPTTAQLAAAVPLSPYDPVQQRFTDIPLLDPRVVDQVTQVLGNGTVDAAQLTPYERVRRIHGFLTDRANGFSYSLSTEPGTSGNDLVDFLEMRRGYCEQYAGAMAVMVRAAGVPARVALGYTPGEEQEDGSRLITSDDAHAWVEVFFRDLGWVPFDPTPISASRSVEMPWAPRADAPDDAVDGLDVPAPALPPQATPLDRLDRGGEGFAAGASDGDGGGLLGPLLAVVGTLALVAVAGSVPAGLRVLQRRRRVATGTPAALWDELVATGRDVGFGLHPAWAPRRAARELAARMAVPGSDASGPGADAVHLLALAEEAASYGPPGSSGPARPELTTALRTARRELLAATPRAGRLRARLWPASLVSGAGTRVADDVTRRLPVRFRGTRTV